ncbi:hypothetical protein LTR84_008662 [Exophiala bonariae]|uniref:NAD(P)-binding protein n=1 Tax=Exophiala bonariae TaxID=1690606 RepID=A0AAV9N0N2_9EURO|nr:hypothetical protein LTR84_008662 [Exophiala bonariae]
MSTKAVLVTGCSDGGLGSALCLALQNKGYRVFATARNVAKMSAVEAVGIQCLALEVTSNESIKTCVAEVSKLTGGTLDVLVNNAGRDYMMPVLDIDLDQMRATFETNVFSYVAITRAFFPLLVRSTQNPMIVNNTSVNSLLPLAFNRGYNASKAAAAMLSSQMRVELHNFGIKLVELKTGAVKSNIWTFDPNDTTRQLPPSSVYESKKELLEKSVFQQDSKNAMPADQWAAQVVKDITKANPPPIVWKGGSAWLARVASLLPTGWTDGEFRKMSDLEGITAHAAQLIREKDKI